MAHPTLAATNQFRFTCPIFEVETRMSHCVQLRNIAYYGGNPAPVRRGCQACIKDGKCPASEIVRRISYGREVSDHYGSSTPVKGPIERGVLERVADVIVTDKTMDFMGATPGERAKIATASERIRKMVGSAPAKVSNGGARRSTPRKTTAAAAVPPSVNSAAATGDLAAAISA